MDDLILTLGFLAVFISLGWFCFWVGGLVGLMGYLAGFIFTGILSNT